MEIHEIHFLRLLCRSFWLTIDSESGYHPFGLRKLENLVRHTFFPLYMCREISIGSFHSRFSLKSSSTYFYKIWWNFGFNFDFSNNGRSHHLRVQVNPRSSKPTEVPNKAYLFPVEYFPHDRRSVWITFLQSLNAVKFKDLHVMPILCYRYPEHYSHKI